MGTYDYPSMLTEEGFWAVVQDGGSWKSLIFIPFWLMVNFSRMQVINLLAGDRSNLFNLSHRYLIKATIDRALKQQDEASLQCGPQTCPNTSS